MNLFLSTLSTMIQKKEVTINGKLFIFGVTKYNLGVIILPNLESIDGIELDGDTFEEFVKHEIPFMEELGEISAPVMN